LRNKAEQLLRFTYIDVVRRLAACPLPYLIGSLSLFFWGIFFSSLLLPHAKKHQKASLLLDIIALFMCGYHPAWFLLFIDEDPTTKSVV